MTTLSVKRTSLLVVMITGLMLLFASLFQINANAATPTKGDKVVSYALTLKGSPFKYGGTTPKGFDASGYTQYVYAKSVKVKLPRTSVDQYKVEKSVQATQLKKGDLVFYKTYGKTVSFVGIYIGKDQFIGTTSSGVKVQSMKTSYWKSKYVGAKRIVQ